MENLKIRITEVLQLSGFKCDIINSNKERIAEVHVKTEEYILHDCGCPNTPRIVRYAQIRDAVVNHLNNLYPNGYTMEVNNNTKDTQSTSDYRFFTIDTTTNTVVIKDKRF